MTEYWYIADLLPAGEVHIVQGHQGEGYLRINLRHLKIRVGGVPLKPGLYTVLSLVNDLE